jgi:hypothetical protein
MDKNSRLTQINSGGLHEMNPNGGVMIGQNNSVEEGETISNDFVYSNRIMLDANIVSQYNLPKSLVGKSIADATKMIDSKFKGRNDKISQSTKDLMLSKIAEAQEAMKPQEPEMEQPQEGMEQGYPQEIIGDGQMAFGGFKNSVIGQGFGEDATSEQKSAAFGAGLNTLTSTLDLGRTAFGKPMQDTRGLAASEAVNTGGMITSTAMKGASAGSAFGPLGAGIGAGVGAIAGLLGSGKAKKAAMENTKNFAMNSNKQFVDTYAMGGLMEDIDPKKKILTSNATVNSLLNSKPLDNNSLNFDTKKIVKYQPGVMNDKMGSGFYLYSKEPTEAGFDYKRDREFVKQAEMMAVQRTPQWQDYMTSQSLKPAQLAKGGKLKPLESFLKPTTNSDLKMSTNAASINDFKSPVINNLNTTKPTFGQELKLFGKDALNTTVNAIKNVDLGNIARYAPIAMNAYQLSKLEKPQGERLERLTNRYRPEYVDEKSLQNIADNTMNNSLNAISQSGASQGQLRSSLIGSQLQRTKALSDAYMNASSQNRATNDRSQTFNLGVDQVNLNQSNTEKDINARDQAAYRNEKSKYLSEIGNNIGDVGKEEVYKNIISKSIGYKWDGEYVKTSNGDVVTDPSTGKPMTQERLKEMQSAGGSKKALGGYLIKNRKK